MWIGVISLFPEMFQSLDYGIPGKARKNHIYELTTINPRDFTDDKYRTVDDRPYGGGPGMVMMAEPLFKAIQHAKQCPKAKPRVIYTSPQGKTLTHAKALALSLEPALVFVSGRYEGIDERVIESAIDEEISIGDYVLSGGEFATMVCIDAIIRLLPGALGHEQSAHQDSFSDGLLDYPHYTRPESWRGMTVPEVLLSGDHAAIKQWRHQQALERTRLRRPDLLASDSQQNE